MSNDAEQPVERVVIEVEKPRCNTCQAILPTTTFLFTSSQCPGGIFCSLRCQRLAEIIPLAIEVYHAEGVQGLEEFLNTADKNKRFLFAGLAVASVLDSKGQKIRRMR